MGTLWREYGVIAVLLTVSVGGYLYLSESEEDLLGLALQSVSDHLLALVPDPGDRDEALAALSLMEDRVASGEVSPSQMERLAASIMNLRSSGAQLQSGEAEMMVRVAMEDPAALPAPAGAPPAPPTAGSAPSRAEMTASAARVQTMFELWRDVDEKARARGEDSGFGGAPAVRFYADGGLRAVVDERLRSDLENDEVVIRSGAERLLLWQPRLAESVEAESERISGEVREIVAIMTAHGDSLDEVTSRRISKLVMLDKLRANGAVLPARAESLAVHEKRDLMQRLGNRTAVEVSVSGPAERTISASDRPSVPATGLNRD